MYWTVAGASVRRHKGFSRGCAAGGIRSMAADASSGKCPSLGVFLPDRLLSGCPCTARGCGAARVQRSADIWMEHGVFSGKSRWESIRRRDAAQG